MLYIRIVQLRIHVQQLLNLTYYISHFSFLWIFCYFTDNFTTQFEEFVKNSIENLRNLFQNLKKINIARLIYALNFKTLRVKFLISIGVIPVTLILIGVTFLPFKWLGSIFAI